MYQFTVHDVTCGHCVSTIAKAVKSEDPKATVDISLREHESRLSPSFPRRKSPGSSRRRATRQPPKDLKLQPAAPVQVCA